MLRGRARALRNTGKLEVAGGFYAKCFIEPFRTLIRIEALASAHYERKVQTPDLARYQDQARPERLGTVASFHRGNHSP